MNNRFEFQKKRKFIYDQIEDFWPDLYETEYALLDVILFTEQDVEEIKIATNRVGKIFYKTAKLLRQVDDETLFQIDIPKEVLPYIRHQYLPVESVIARCDFVKTKDGYKLLELNADTPTFIKEVFHVNRYITEYFGVENPNKGLENELARSIQKAILESAIKLKNDNPNIVFTSHDDHEEDKFTTKYLLEISEIRAKFVPLHKLTIINNEGLYDENGQKIDILYRQTYPLEHLILDEDPVTKEKVGVQLLDLVIQNKLAIINPISAFLLQSKAVQAVIWGLYEKNHPFFTKEEKEWIKAYFLPTYLDNDFFVQHGLKYVKKPSYGREGDTVEIFLGTEKVLEDPNKTYHASIPVYQQFVELPFCTIQTSHGKKEAKFLIGSFLVNGKASGFGVRAGGQITDNGAYFLPVGIQ